MFMFGLVVVGFVGIMFTRYLKDANTMYASCIFNNISVLQSCVVKEVPAHNGRYDMGCNPDQVLLLYSISLIIFLFYF